MKFGEWDIPSRYLPTEAHNAKSFFDQAINHINYAHRTWQNFNLPRKGSGQYGVHKTRPGRSRSTRSGSKTSGA